MGYRSDVKMIYTTNRKGECEKFLDKLKTRYKNSKLEKTGYEDILESIKIRSAKDYDVLTFEMGGVKWYETYYEEIKIFMEWLDEIIESVNDRDEENCGLHYVRMGESADDLEELYEGSPACYVNIYRGLGFDTLENALGE